MADKINWLSAEHVTDYTAHEGSATPNKPSTEFFRAIRVSTVMVRALFSEETYRIFKAAEEMIGRGLGPPGQRRTVEEFVQAYDSVMHSMYAEISLDFPSAKAKPASLPGR